MAAGSETASREESPRYRYLVVGMLAFAYMLNFVDRQLISILVEPIKAELGLSDTQVGMLTGLMFALFYTVFGIPMAMIADRRHRVKLVAVACGLWSLFTAASGMATSFVQLAIARVGVGIGEAGCSPPSYSILSDYFPPEQRGRALGLYVLGVPAGSFVGTLAGAWIAAHYGWRVAFYVLGCFGLLFAPLLVLIVREPPRGRYDDEVDPAESSDGVWESLTFFWRSPVFILTAIACGVTSFCSYGLLNWTPAYLGRVQGMTLSQISMYFSVAVAGSMVMAAWIGALISDRAGARNPAFYALGPGAGILLTIPFVFFFTGAQTWQGSLALVVLPILLTSIYLVPALTLLQNRTPARYRATVSSILLFLLNLIGLGCGPLFVGAMSDYLEPTHGVGALGLALRWLTPFMALAFVLQAATAWLIARESRRPAA